MSYGNAYLLLDLHHGKVLLSVSRSNFPFLCSNIPAAPAYGVYISQLIRYSRACCRYYDFLKRAQLLTHKLLQQGVVAQSLMSSLQKFYGRYHELVDRYGTSVSKMKTYFSLWQLSSFLFHRILHDQHGGCLIRNRRCLLYRCT